MTNVRTGTERLLRGLRGRWWQALTAILALGLSAGLVLAVADDDGGAQAAEDLPACSQGRDCQVLLAVKGQLAGTGTLNWSASLPMASWDGITLRFGRVTRLHLIDRGLTGTLPPGLSELTRLDHISLNENELTGGIPAEWASLPRLRGLSLTRNSLTGSIPAELGSAPRLAALYLRHNQLTGSIPEELGHSSTLYLLSVERNKLTGSLPASLGGLTTLWVAGNSFTGCVPPELRKVKVNDLASLRLPTCAAGTPTPTPTATASPTATATATASPTATATPDPLPAVTIAAASTSVIEGRVVRFAVSRTGATASALTVSLRVSETGATLIGAAPTSATIPTGAATVVIDVATEDDSADEPDSVVTATVTAGEGYSPGSPDSAAVTVADNDATAPTSLRYDTYDTTGVVMKAGSYAFLSNGGGTESGADRASAGGDAATVLTSYEGLREDADMLRVHLTDADGVARASFYGTVTVGDMFEWRIADDCWTRYEVLSAPVAELATDTTSSHRDFGVQPLSYAFTGCSGAVAASTVGRADFGPLPVLGGPSLTVPVIHGIFQLVPASWTGATKPVGPRMPARPAIPSVETTSLIEARKLPHWREPELPEGWTFSYAVSGDEAEAGYFTAYYNGLDLTVSAAGINAKYSPKPATAAYSNGSQTSVRETLQIAGRPARVHRSLTAKQFPTTVHVWDEATGVLYALQWSGHAAELITLAESMFE